MRSMCVFITQIAPGPGKGPLLAVKDLIDVVGTPTTAGSRAVADNAVAATKDALCIAGARYLELGLMARRTLLTWATEGPESTTISGHLSILWIQPGSQEGLRAVQRWR
jgi:Asp-tRNA(Asn)/Glu-tRNA(Gln) amidotransferase A subunit family amidase